MHRSGTSALARVLNLLGVELSPNLLPPRVDNPKGFWEQRAILETHEAILAGVGSWFDDFLPLPEEWEKQEWVKPFRQKLLDIVLWEFGKSQLWGFKDPRTCRLMALWPGMLQELKMSGRYVLMVRHPDEIARSLAVRNGYSYNKSLLLTFAHLLEAEARTRGLPRVVVTYDELMSDWRATAAKISRILGIQWTTPPEAVSQAVDEFLDPGLRHHKSASAERGTGVNGRCLDSNAVKWIDQLHANLVAAASNPAALDVKLMDRLKAEFAGDRPRLENWREHYSVDARFTQVEEWGIGLDKALQAAKAENASLRLELAQERDRRTGEGLTGAGSAGTSSAVPADPAAPPARKEGENGNSFAALAAAQQAADREISDLRAGLAERDSSIAHLQARVRELDLTRKWLASEKDAQIERVNRERDEAIAGLRQRIEWLDQHVAQLQAHAAELSQARDWLSGEKERLAGWASELERGRTWLTEEVGRLKEELSNKDAALADLRKWTAELEQAKRWLTEEVQRRDTELAARKSRAGARQP